MARARHSGLKQKIATLAALTVLCIVLLAWFYRDELFRSLNDPGQPFQTYIPPPALDYRDDQAWLAMPDLALDPEKIEGDADIFVVAPGLYLGGDHWVAPVQDSAFQSQQERIITPNYVAPYSIGGRVFAPRYREAALYSFLTNRDDARAAQNFAYEDVKRAFELFLTYNAPERPIILIGHNQGGLHVQRLLADFFAGELSDQLAAAYIIDHPTPLDILPEATPPCESDNDVNCVVSFGSFTPKDGIAATHFVTRSLVFDGKDMTPVQGRPLLCTNPLLWNRSRDFAPQRLHKGAIAAVGLDPSSQAAPAPRQTSAQCADGILIIDRPKSKSLRRKARFGGRYRTAPYNMFNEDIRQNMLMRIDALIVSGGLPERAPLMEDMPMVDIIESPVTLPGE